MSINNLPTFIIGNGHHLVGRIIGIESRIKPAGKYSSSNDCGFTRVFANNDRVRLIYLLGCSNGMGNKWVASQANFYELASQRNGPKAIIMSLHLNRIALTREEDDGYSNSQPTI